MSLILALSIEELMQPGFTGSDGVARNPRSDANFSPYLCSCPAAILSRSRPELRFLTRSRAEDNLFYQECTVKDGRIEQTNFDSYNSMRISEMPRVESIIMPSGGFWGGVGEPTIFVAALAVLNATFAATGKRIRSFPLMHHSLRLV